MTGPLISAVHGRRVWDSRGRPTLEVEVRVRGGAVGVGAAPAGASRGENEAIEVRDGGPRLGGLDVTRAIRTVESLVLPALVGMDVRLQSQIDAVLDGLDTSPTRSSIGGNVTVATSIAVLQAAAANEGLALWQYLEPDPVRIPRPEIQIVGGGAHAGRALEVQDFMVVPLSATEIQEALVQVAEVYRQTGKLLSSHYRSSGVADEGGHWPVLPNAEAVLALITDAIERTGLVPGVDMGLSLDIAASEFFEDGAYSLKSEGVTLDRPAWIDRLAAWTQRYPIVAIEDPVESSDADGMVEVTRRLGGSTLIVGDDYLVTNAERIHRAANSKSVTSALIKPNQAGTITAARLALGAAKDRGLASIVSARSGETEDTVVADLATAWGADLIKVGSITRGERTAKWNQLIRIDARCGGLELAPFPTPRVVSGANPRRSATRSEQAGDQYARE